MIKNSHLADVLDYFNRMDLSIVDLAWERIRNERQVFDPHTHRVLPQYRDRNFAYLVLRAVLAISGCMPELVIHLSRDEKRLLNRRFSRQAAPKN
jgi:hypothetical protein